MNKHEPVKLFADVIRYQSIRLSPYVIVRRPKNEHFDRKLWTIPNDLALQHRAEAPDGRVWEVWHMRGCDRSVGGKMVYFHSRWCLVEVQQPVPYDPPADAWPNLGPGRWSGGSPPKEGGWGTATCIEEFVPGTSVRHSVRKRLIAEADRLAKESGEQND